MFNKLIIYISVCLLLPVSLLAQTALFSGKKTPTSFSLGNAAILVDSNDYVLVKKSVGMLQEDMLQATGKKPPIIYRFRQDFQTIIAVGSLQRSTFVRNGNIHPFDSSIISGKWEAYTIQTQKGKNKQPGIILIAGNDRRGTAFGVFEFSKQLGISPWNWWADVPVIQKKDTWVNDLVRFVDSPKVKYRGIFINDEAPALSGWSKEKFGGFNHLFYAKVFELLLRLKSNYIWPAMWGSAFYDDDSLNMKTADEYGIVIGTSHHEPLMRAHDEWRRIDGGKWNYDSNATALQHFWKKGMQRATNEKIVTIGMRGDGDEPMSRETATSLLEKIVEDQRKIISEVTNKAASETPQLWALYKEVQDYYDKGMRVPDDVTLLLCDDNWGNLRKLPKINDPKRAGGNGIYYHFDYVGGPRNYKWINTNPLPRIWEQMHLAWEYNVKDIWIVNVGDIKPLELPISFFLDMAWNPDLIGPAGIAPYTVAWAKQQFGETSSIAIADILAKYAKYNGRVKPELLDAKTFDLSSGEFDRVTDDYRQLSATSEMIENKLPAIYQDAYYQLVQYPVEASANLYQMYNAQAWNKYYAGNEDAKANKYAIQVKNFYTKDSMLMLSYHQLRNGKWNHMMAQTHIGYTYWQQPEVQRMPEVTLIPVDEAGGGITYQGPIITTATKLLRNKPVGILFVEENSFVSIGADHFSEKINTNGIEWQVLPDLGLTGSAITSFPVTHAPTLPLQSNSAHLEYKFYTRDKDSCRITAFFSPTLNFHNTTTGLRYAVSIDDDTPQIISINAGDNQGGTWYKWVAENIIKKTTANFLKTKGMHVLKYWAVDPGVVLQKLVLGFGDEDKTYLGPPETKY